MKTMSAVPYHFEALIAAGVKPPKQSYVPVLVDGPLLLLTTKYQHVVRDLWTVWFLYAFRYRQFSRGLVIKRIATILQECADLRSSQQEFTDLYDIFFQSVYVCTAAILSVTSAAELETAFGRQSDERYGMYEEGSANPSSIPAKPQTMEPICRYWCAATANCTLILPAPLVDPRPSAFRVYLSSSNICASTTARDKCHSF